MPGSCIVAWTSPSAKHKPRPRSVSQGGVVGGSRTGTSTPLCDAGFVSRPPAKIPTAFVAAIVPIVGPACEVRPFRAFVVGDPNPGRCPGLYWGDPSGLPERTSAFMGARVRLRLLLYIMKPSFLAAVRRFSGQPDSSVLRRQTKNDKRSPPTVQLRPPRYARVWRSGTERHPTRSPAETSTRRINADAPLDSKNENWRLDSPTLASVLRGDQRLAGPWHAWWSGADT